jgi:hypothetical protein
MAPLCHWWKSDYSLSHLINWPAHADNSGHAILSPIS